MYSYGSPHMAAQKQDDQLERTFSSYVRIQDVVLKTYLGRWTIGRSGERGSGLSVLPARYDDDELTINLRLLALLRLKVLGVCMSQVQFKENVQYHHYRNTAIRVQFLDKTDCISHSTNTLGKGMNPIILPPAMGK